MNERQLFLKKLQNDPSYQKFVAEPLRVQRAEFDKILKDVSSTEEQVRYAQGALKIIDQHEWLFEKNDAQILASERSRKEKENARDRKPNYSYGRYCT